MTRAPRPKSDKDGQVTIVLPAAWLDEAQELVRHHAEPGRTFTRSDVLRMALRRGLDGLEADARKRPGKR